MAKAMKKNFVPDMTQVIMEEIEKRAKSTREPLLEQMLEVTEQRITNSVNDLYSHFVDREQVLIDDIKTLSKETKIAELRCVNKLEELENINAKLVDMIAKFQQEYRENHENITRRLSQISALENNILKKFDSYCREELKSDHTTPINNNESVNKVNAPAASDKGLPPHYAFDGSYNNEEGATSNKPFNTNELDAETKKEVWRGIPRAQDWEKFSGEPPYNHETWLKQINVFVRDYIMTDAMIISRLGLLFTKSAKTWYTGLRDSNDNQSWE
ncbi:hypothetical protein PTTG_29705 [Puccinia triticina 1-1 BBBD Race 1]|uniref:Uncharacterized protein n=1 Tax=Puccinia triticina (isolate 1-1 / race 1 (BBBD)) TaxID=630390 RepID=A0A180G2K6_PUCT1|nr:hypothetical protein PTTG_29705 [Puccinia triticina 1-1 BBBD Race 1]